MKTTAIYPVSDFLSKSQIKKHNLQQCTCHQSLLASDKTNILGIIDKNGDSIPIYILRLKNGKYIVKYNEL